MTAPTIESVLDEKRLFAPPAHFSEQAYIKNLGEYQDLYRKAEENPEAFWGELADQELHWFKKWDKVLQWHPPEAKWFTGGQINISYNCLGSSPNNLAKE